MYTTQEINILCEEETSKSDVSQYYRTLGSSLIENGWWAMKLELNENFPETLKRCALVGVICRKAMNGYYKKA